MAETGGDTCALSPDGLAERLAAWRTVGEQALSRKKGHGWVLSSYPRASLGGLKALIDAEAECCPFLSFHLRESGETIEVELRYPPEFEAMVTLILGDTDATA